MLLILFFLNVYLQYKYNAKVIARIKKSKAEILPPNTFQRFLNEKVKISNIVSAIADINARFLERSSFNINKILIN